jgi:hypothetical protein
MGVKSTVTLTREEAERKYFELMLEHARRQIRASTVPLDNKTLEDVLEVLNDAAHDGEGFENYIIEGNDTIPEPEPYRCCY